MPIACQAYYTVRERLSAFLTSVSKPQLTNLSLLTFGLFAAGNSQLPRIAAKLPLLTGAASLTQRLRRLLMNPAIAPTTLYQPVAQFLLSCFTGGSVRLILEAPDLRFHIEEMLRDFKEFGFWLETSHLCDPERVSRLLLCVSGSCAVDERRCLGQQTRPAAACGSPQEAATQLLSDWLALLAETLGLRPTTAL